LKKKALFLDRDGVINIEKNYLYRIEDFEFCKGIFGTVKYFQKRGFLIFVVTNQSGIGRGYYSQKSFYKLTNWMVKRFKNRGIEITKVYHCPHTPKIQCQCRKPDDKMFQDAIKTYNIDVLNSWMIGDKISDLQAAKKSKIGNLILINKQNRGDMKIDFLVNETFEIINIIKEGRIKL